MSKDQIHKALGDLMVACGLGRSESGTEIFVGVLADAVGGVDWSVVEQSHKDGLCFDVNCLLAEEIEVALRRQEFAHRFRCRTGAA